MTTVSILSLEESLQTTNHKTNRSYPSSRWWWWDRCIFKTETDGSAWRSHEEVHNFGWPNRGVAGESLRRRKRIEDAAGQTKTRRRLLWGRERQEESWILLKSEIGLKEMYQFSALSTKTFRVASIARRDLAVRAFQIRKFRNFENQTATNVIHIMKWYSGFLNKYCIHLKSNASKIENLRIVLNAMSFSLQISSDPQMYAI